jgi:hypothetical protein
MEAASEEDLTNLSLNAHDTPSMKQGSKQARKKGTAKCEPPLGRFVSGPLLRFRHSTGEQYEDRP